MNYRALILAISAATAILAVGFAIVWSFISFGNYAVVLLNYIWDNAWSVPWEYLPLVLIGAFYIKLIYDMYEDWK